MSVGIREDFKAAAAYRVYGDGSPTQQLDRIGGTPVSELGQNAGLDTSLDQTLTKTF